MNEIQIRKNILENYKAIKEAGMTKEEIFSFIQTFLCNLPESLDPLSEEFIPILPIFVTPIDADTYPFEMLKEWSDTRRTAYAVRLYAQLQYMLITKDTTINFNEEINNNIWGVKEEHSGVIKNELTMLTKYASDILKSETKEEKKAKLAYANVKIREITGVCSPRQNVEMFCFFNHIPYKKNINFYEYIENNLKIKKIIRDK